MVVMQPFPAHLATWFAHRARRAPPLAPPGNERKGDEAKGGRRSLAETSVAAQARHGADAGDVAAALEIIPNADLGWDDWNRIGMACWRACDGAAEGLVAFERWSQRSRKWSEGGAAERWAHYATSPPTSIDFGTLVHEARRSCPGWLPPSRLPKEVMLSGSVNGSSRRSETLPAPDNLAQGRAQLPGAAALPAVNGYVVDHMVEALLKATPVNPLIELNDRYCTIGNIGGKCLVMSWENSKIDENVKVPAFQSFKSFAERYAHRYVTIDDEPKALGNYWLRWPQRRSYDAVDLSPGEGVVLGNVAVGGTLNLWRGFAITPQAGQWSLMRAHVAQVLAAGQPAAAEYILRFAAWAVQNPGERAEVALVFRGGKGSGKGTFASALRDIFGSHGVHIFSSKHMVGQFNAHLRTCLLLFADEAFWAGDKQGESTLKGMLTERTLPIEQKGVDTVFVRNRLHVVMSANADWAVPASHDERRYAVFNVSGERIGDFGYFQALRDEIASGGLAAMLADLLALDLRGWHPRHVVATAALQEQKARSLSPLAEWWEHVLQTGRARLLRTENAVNAVSAAELLAMAREFAPRANINPTQLGRVLKEFGLWRTHTKDGEYWNLPTLSKARERWENKFGWWPWEEKIENWRR